MLEEPQPSEAGGPSPVPMPAVKAEEDWEAWSYEQCTLRLKRQSKFPPAIFRLAQLLNSDYNKPEEAQQKLNDVIRYDKDFFPAKVAEL